jgi:NAD+ synthase
MYEFCTDYEKMYKNIVKSAGKYIMNSKVKSLVLGMSGGIDSTLTAALASEVKKEFKLKDLLVRGHIISIESLPSETDRGKAASEVFCDNSYHYCFDDVYTSLRSDPTFMDILKIRSFKDRIRCGNLKARLRMIKLYDAAQKYDGMVLSTDNYTEFLLGFWTLHGDVGDFGMIQNLWKTEVYRLSEYLVDKYTENKEDEKAQALRDGINAIPTDGLGVTASDFDQLCPEESRNGSPLETYNKIDVVLYENLIARSAQEDNTVIRRHINTSFKRQNPLNIPREDIVA